MGAMEKVKQLVRSKKASFDKLSGAGMGIVIFAVILGVGAVIVDKLSEQLNSTTAQGIITTLQNAMSDLADWAPLFVVAIAGFLILRYFGVLGGRK